jgi:WD40 repeat protein
MDIHIAAAKARRLQQRHESRIAESPGVSAAPSVRGTAHLDAPPTDDQLATASTEPEMEALVELKDPNRDVPGLKITKKLRCCAIARIPISKLDSILKDDNVVSVEANRTLSTKLDFSVASIGASELGRFGYSGANCIVGAYDYELDPTHPCFRNDDGTTRILSLWNQSALSGTPPAGEEIGAEYTREAIDQLLQQHPGSGAANRIYGPKSFLDSHGTHVMGIAAGNGRGLGTQPGVSPESPIVFVDPKYERSDDDDRIRLEHDESVLGVVFSSDSAQLGTVTHQSVQLWDVATAKVIKRLDGIRGPHLRLPANAPPLLIGTDDDFNEWIWEFASGRKITQLEEASLLTLKAVGLRRSTLAGSDYNSTSVGLWDLQTGGKRGMLDANQGIVSALDFSPDGSHLAVGYATGTVVLWECENATEVKRLTGHSNKVNSIAFAPNGQLLVTASDDESVRLWDVGTGNEVRTLTHPVPSNNGASASVIFSRDGKMLATDIGIDTVVWDVQQWSPIKILERASAFTSGTIDFSPDGEQIAIADEIYSLVASHTEHNLGNSINMIRALDYMLRIADDLNKPVVINLSLGENNGPNDGSTLLEMEMDAMLTEKAGRCIVIAAGNEGDTPIHTSFDLNAAGDVHEFRVSYSGDSGEVHLWSEAPLRVTMHSPSQSDFGPYENGDTVNLPNSQGIVSSHPHRDRFHFIFDANKNAEDGEWKFSVEAVAATKVHVWVKAISYFDRIEVVDGDTDYTLNSIATGQHTIAVGARNGQSKEVGDMASFSSVGPTVEQIPKPNISAPGSQISAPKDRTATAPNEEVVRMTTMKSGTSMAAPHVAGAAALLLSALEDRGLPRLSIERTVDLIQRSGGNQWDPQAGFGDINLPRLFKLAGLPLGEDTSSDCKQA